MENQISSKQRIADSLMQRYDRKLKNQTWFFNELNNEFDIQNYTLEKSWQRLAELSKEDSLIAFYKMNEKLFLAFNKQMGFETPNKWKDFIEDNLFQQIDINNKNKSSKIITEIERLKIQKKDIQKKILIKSEQVRISFNAFVFSGILLFLLRYIFYGIRWSIKTLKH